MQYSDTQYDEIENPIGAKPIGAKQEGEAFKVAYVAREREHRRWLCGWKGGPRWSEKRGDAIWVAPGVGRAIREQFGHYLNEGGKVRLFDRPPPHARLKETVGRDYWAHVT